MKILSIEPRDIYIVNEFSLEKLKLLKDFLSASTIEYDSQTEPELEKAAVYVTKELYPNLVQLITSMENGK